MPQAVSISMKVLSILLSISCSFSFQQLKRYNHNCVATTSISAEMSSTGRADVSLTLAQRVTNALENHKSGLLDEAIVSYENVLPELTGKLASTLHSNVGSIYMNKGENDRAKDHFTLAVEAEPDNANAHFNLAVILTSKFEVHGKAIKHCGTALKLDPSMYKALHLMGNILQNLGKDIEAERYFVMAENLARELTEQTLQAVPDRNEKDRESELGWARFKIMEAKSGEEFNIQKSEFAVGNTGVRHDEDYRLICISERPLVFRIPQFMTHQEGDHIIGRADKQLKKSFVMGGQTAVADRSDTAQLADDGSAAKDVDTSQLYRSSYNAWLHPDELATQLQRRLAHLTGFPLQLFSQKSEELQVVKYEHGGQFKVHHDSSAFHPRLLTALLYLNDVPEGSGGETWFPFAGERRDFTLTVEEAIFSALEMHESSSAAPTCPLNIELADSDRHETGTSHMGLYVRPVRGDAIIFFNHLPSGAIDPAAVHAGLPMRDSSTATPGGVRVKTQNIEKWIANYWVEQDFKILFAEN
jgi:prolyl 4-hydroxylase